MRTLPVMLAGLLILGPALVRAAPVSETRDMAPDGHVSIIMVNGSAVIRGWDRPEFSIEGEISDQATGFELSGSGGDITFEEEYGSRSGCWFGMGCNNNGRGDSVYEIQAPVGANLSFEGVNVSVEVTGLQSGAHITVVNGNITVTDISGFIELETVNGSINSSDLSGRVSMSTVNGKIEDSGSTAERADFTSVNGSIRSDISSPRIEAETVNGAVTLTAGAVDELKAASVNGDLVLGLALNSGGRVDVSSFGGDIDLRLPTSTSARFDISSSSGTIRNDLSDHEVETSGRFRKTHQLNFILEGGSGNVGLSSFSGDIRIRGE